jgi:hypothetical protein
MRLRMRTLGATLAGPQAYGRATVVGQSLAEETDEVRLTTMRGLGGAEFFKHGKPTILKENALRENSGSVDSGVVRGFGSSHTNIYLHIIFKEILVDHEEHEILRSRSKPLA